jgi:DNA mismatch repair ATPase MutL
MPQDKSAVDDFLKDLNDESKGDLFNTDEKDPLEDPKKPEDVEGTEDDDKKVPFHKNPKVMKFVEKQIKKAMESYKPAAADAPRQESKTDSDEVTKTLEAIIGNDTAEKRAAVEYLRSLGDKASERAIEKMRKEQEEKERQQSEEDKEALEELESGIEEIEENYNVDFDKNPKQLDAFKEYLLELAPRRNGVIVGFPNIPAAWKEFAEKSKRPNTRAKDFAARSVARPGDSTAAPQSTDHSWDAVDRMLSKLSN